jgi:RNA polymerase sigma factor (sigma-70 family)
VTSTRTDVLAARRGDPTAFARLVHGNTNAVCAITTAILGNARAGEEVGQEVFVCAWQGLGKLEDPDRFGAWLRGIARNRAREALRSKAQRREVVGEVLAALADPAPDPGERLDGERQEAALWAALEGLDEDHREVLVLYYREGQSVEQVARQLELPEPTVRKRLSRARERLRDDVGDRLGQRLTHSAPKVAAFAVAVTAALAPLPARAAVPALAKVAGGLLAAALVLSAGTWATLRSQLPEIPATAPADRVLGDVSPEAERPSALDERPDELPDHVVHAFLAAEDARFYEHGPVDLRAIGRAAWHNWTRDERAQGGSTLTQQLAKQMLVQQMPEPGLWRKLSEVVMAVELERRLTKDEILARYLDAVYFGASARGLEDAARVYFDKPASALTLAEGALLAGIPSHPKAHSPFEDPERAERRRSEVLQAMAAHGWASPQEVAAAEAEALPVRRP